MALIGDLEEATAEQQAHATTTGAAEDRRSSKAGERRPRGRQPLPAHLPRERVVHAPACACPACGGTVLTRLGEDEREVLDDVPSHFKVMVHVRPKMSCRQCETIIQAPVPSLPIERGRPGPNLLAHVLVAKYCDHVPLHRQSVIYGRAGVELERSTLADWVGQAAFLLEFRLEMTVPDPTAPEGYREIVARPRVESQRAGARAEPASRSPR